MRATVTMESMDAVTHQAVRTQHLRIAFFMARNILERGCWHNKAICNHAAMLSSRHAHEK